MVVAGTQGGGGVHHATDTGAACIIQISAELQIDMWHDRLDADRKDWAMDVGVEGKGIVKENYPLATCTL